MGTLAPGRGISANIGIAVGGSTFTDGLDSVSMSSAAGGAALGGLFGKYAPDIIHIYIGKDLPGFTYDIGSSFITEIGNGALRDALKPSEKTGVLNGK